MVDKGKYNDRRDFIPSMRDRVNYDRLDRMFWVEIMSSVWDMLNISCLWANAIIGLEPREKNLTLR